MCLQMCLLTIVFPLCLKCCHELVCITTNSPHTFKPFDVRTIDWSLKKFAIYDIFC